MVREHKAKEELRKMEGEILQSTRSWHLTATVAYNTAPHRQAPPDMSIFCFPSLESPAPRFEYCIY
jgi:hypothetical protein